METVTIDDAGEAQLSIVTQPGRRYVLAIKPADDELTATIQIAVSGDIQIGAVSTGLPSAIEELTYPLTDFGGALSLEILAPAREITIYFTLGTENDVWQVSLTEVLS